MHNMSPTTLTQLRQLIGKPPTSATSLLSSLSSSDTPQQAHQPESKWYGDVVYLNFPRLGISLCCESSKKGAKIPKDYAMDSLVVESIDLYNPISSASTTDSFSSFSGLPLCVTPELDLDTTTRGKDLVAALGEPSKKGGPPPSAFLGGSSGNWSALEGVWLEWEKEGLHVSLKESLGDAESSQDKNKGAMGGIWDRAANWKWTDLKVFAAIDA